MLKRIVLAGLLVLATCGTALADDYVRGYTRQNGAYVPGYYRSSPDYTVTNNYSFYGNSNPYTGSVGTNRYYSAPSSPYYSPPSSYGYSPSYSYSAPRYYDYPKAPPTAPPSYGVYQRFPY